MKIKLKTNHDTVYSVICLKVAKYGEEVASKNHLGRRDNRSIPIEKVKPSTKVCEQAFNAVFSRRDIKKTLGHRWEKISWRKGVTVAELANLMWPRKKK